MYLTINGLFSAISGLAMLIFSKSFNDFFQVVNTYVFPLIGINLLPFSIFVLYVSRYQLKNKSLVTLIVILDVLWVVGSVVIISLDLFDLALNGKILMAVVAVWIGFLGYKQFQNT